MIYVWILTFKFWPSNGKDPLTRVYNITPKLHTSTSGPSYFLPAHRRQTVQNMSKKLKVSKSDSIRLKRYIVTKMVSDKVSGFLYEKLCRSLESQNTAFINCCAQKSDAASILVSNKVKGDSSSATQLKQSSKLFRYALNVKELNLRRR